MLEVIIIMRVMARGRFRPEKPVSILKVQAKTVGYDKTLIVHTKACRFRDLSPEEDLPK